VHSFIPWLTIGAAPLSAVQNTRFEMNEKGVELKPEAHMAFGCGREAPRVRQHRMIFDKPFLLLMERAGANLPHFALWVDNAELLVPWQVAIRCLSVMNDLPLDDLQRDPALQWVNLGNLPAQYDAREALLACAYSFKLSPRFREGIGQSHRRERKFIRRKNLLQPSDIVEKAEP